MRDFHCLNHTCTCTITRATSILVQQYLTFIATRCSLHSFHTVNYWIKFVIGAGVTLVTRKQA
jgi:hypothetical protein